MWIRSQDDTELMEVKRIQVDGKKIYTFDLLSSETPWILLGEYINQDRAMEVIEKIERHIETLQRLQLNIAGYDKGHLVFKMPEM